MPESKKLLGTKDVAYLLDCSPDDVIRLAQTNKVRAVKMGRRWCFRFKDIEEFKKKSQRRLIED